jgi:hypothetical protein
MGRHPPKNLSQAIMARILMWREQVAEVGDLSPRARRHFEPVSGVSNPVSLNAGAGGRGKRKVAP